MIKRNILLSILSGLLLALCMPKPGVWILAWVALIPLFVALRGAGLRRGALYGLAAGLVYFGVTLFWISIFGYLPWVLLILIEAAFIAAFAGVCTVLMPGRTGWWGYLAVPAAWTAMQWTRSLGPYSFTWGSLAHTQANNIPIIQLASVTGPWGIDFLVCLVNLALAAAVVPEAGRRRAIPAIAAGALVVAAAVGGTASLRGAQALDPQTKVAVIQGNLARGLADPPDQSGRALLVYSKMSLREAREGADLIVWPETTLAAALTESGWGSLVGELAAQSGANYLVGAYDAPDGASAGVYNGAHFYDRSGRKVGVYRKVHLVPFGEFVPLRERLPVLKRYRIRDQDVLPGRSHVLLDSEIGKIGVSICFESLFPQISREETRNGAAALFVITNDSWFERTQAARQHLMMAKLRAAENRRYVVRAAASGISAIVDPYGRTVSELGIFRRGVVSGRIEPLRGLTPYSCFGDYFAYACAALVLLSLVPYPFRKSKVTASAAR